MVMIPESRINYH